jgi:thiamine biosynthesis protein ThiI
MMMRISERLALDSGSKALITGESLGQVASQTLPAIAVTDIVTKELPVLRPLIGMDKEDIIIISRKIDAFETSILPYEDCCTVFTPKHPRTRPTIEDCAEAENVFDFDTLIEKAINEIQYTRITRDGEAI